MRFVPRLWTATVAALVLLTLPCTATAQSTDTINLRGHKQTLRLYGTRGNRPVIISSGYPVRDVEARFAGRDVTAFLGKPYLPEQLRSQVQALLG